MNLPQSIETLLTPPESAMIMVAPPAWGKTRLLFSLFRMRFSHFIFVSPLKALALEFEEKCRIEKIPVWYPKKKKEVKSIIERFWKQSGVLVVIPEVLDSGVLKVDEEGRKPLVVFDEFHLFYYWGSSFREQMNEFMLGICSTGSAILGLTATLSIQHQEIFHREFSLNYQNLWILNLGNQKLKKDPTKIHLFNFGGKKALGRRLWWELRKGRKRELRILFFCRYRHEVDIWVKAVRKKGFCVLGCKGGEVQRFVENLKKYPEVEIIFSTLALGHGVNLPEIHRVFINHKVGNIDFWVQMVGRGGRRGEEFEFFGMDSFLGKKINPKSQVSPFFWDQFLKIFGRI